LDREGFIAIISPVRDLIFTEKIATCYISSVGAGLAPARRCPLLLAPARRCHSRKYIRRGLGQAQPLLFLFFILVKLLCLFYLLIDVMFHCFKILILYQ